MKTIHENRAPLKRKVSTSEVAKVALFLASNMASGITGSTIFVDGGYNIMGV